MGKIIVDTNVWYDGQCPSLKGYTTFITHNNLEELTCTKNMISHFEKVKNALLTMSNCTNELIIFNPIDYLYSLENPGFNFNNLESSPYCESYKAIIRYGEGVIAGGLTSTDFMDVEVVKVIQQKYLTLKSVANGFMIDIESMKKLQTYLLNKKKLPPTLPFCTPIFQNAFDLLVEKKITDKLKFWSEDFSSITNSMFVSLYSALDIDKRIISENIFPDIQLFLRVFELFVKNILFARWRMTANDWFDILSLVYVQPGDKYYTLEGKWNDLIKKADASYLL